MRARVQVAGAHAGLQLGERPVERLAGAGVGLAHAGRRLAERERRAGVAPPGAEARHEVAEHELALGRSRGRRRPPPISAVRSPPTRSASTGRRSPAAASMRLDDARPRLQLAHARLRVLAGGGLPGVADADRGADVLELVGRLDGARAGQRGRGVDDALLAQRRGPAPARGSAPRRRRGRQPERRRAPRPGAPRGSSGPTVKPSYATTSQPRPSAPGASSAETISTTLASSRTSAMGGAAKRRAPTVASAAKPEIQATVNGSAGEQRVAA